MEDEGTPFQSSSWSVPGAPIPAMPCRAEAQAGTNKDLKYNGTPDYVSANVMLGNTSTEIDDVFAMVHLPSISHYILDSLPFDGQPLRCTDRDATKRCQDACKGDVFFACAD